MRFANLVVAVAVLTGASAAPAVANPVLPACSQVVITNCATATTTAAGFGGVVTTAVGGETQSAKSGPRAAKAPLSRTYVDTNLVPTCTGNDYFNGGDLCNAAVEVCPTPGDVRLWVFEATIVRATGRIEPGTRPRLVGTVCRGPQDPALDPAVSLPALVQTQFQSVVVVSGNAQVSPEPETLVNVPTRFQTDAPASYDIPLTLLNQSVVITATAERYVWHLDDGVRTSTQPKGFLEHVYRTAGPRDVFVEIEWSGTFRVNGGPPQPIAGSVTTDGTPTSFQVQQARSELVRD